ncbi:MAG: hypothetical protein Q8O86_08615, partial [Dehalococcoidia bacterium]|nr:hypothetical protein [Dehalococcoidia bacterium]
PMPVGGTTEHANAPTWERRRLAGQWPWLPSGNRATLFSYQSLMPRRGTTDYKNGPLCPSALAWGGFPYPRLKRWGIVVPLDGAIFIPEIAETTEKTFLVFTTALCNGRQLSVRTNS